MPTNSQSKPRTACVILVDRANYGRLHPVMRAIDSHNGLALQVIAAGTMVLERFHRPVDLVRRDGFNVDAEIYMELEGSVPATMAKSIGVGIMEFANELQRLCPDIVVVIGDRYEALAASLAAAYMNIPIVHIQGGEVSGSIDESARHAITKFAHYHVPATARAREYLERMGERPETVLTVGCPSSDIAKSLDTRLSDEVINARGNGVAIDPAKPFVLVAYHPTTTRFGDESNEMHVLLEALDTVRMPTLLLWPNIDAGSDHISKTIRVFRDRPTTRSWLRTRVNIPPDDYLRVLASATLAVGNSSSFVRDSSFFGTPVVLVGDRQDGRESAENVVPAACEKESIAESIQQQLAHGRYPKSTLYGDGSVSARVADALASIDIYVQKQLSYLTVPIS